MKKEQITYAFIDSQNLNLSIRDQGWKLDFKKFRVYLKDKYKVSKAFLFIGYLDKNKRMYNRLKKDGFTLIFKPTLLYKNRGIKGNVDAELVLHTMIEYKNYGKAIIVSGDGDFYCLVEYLLNNKKLGRLLIPNRNKYSRLLYKFEKDIDFLSNLKNKIGDLAMKKGVSQLRTKP